MTLRAPGVSRVSTRRHSFRAGVISFVLMSAFVVALAMGLLVLVDPRTQEYWSGRLGGLLAWIRALVGR